MPNVALNVSLANTNQIAIVDIEWEHRVSQHRWIITRDGYVRRSDNTKQLLHHIVIGKPNKGFDVDHINGNKLDNRKANLRIIPHFMNIHNSKLRKDNKSGYKGIFRLKHVSKRPWWAYIDIKGHRKTIGHFSTKLEAVKARKEVEKLLWQMYH